MADEDVKPAGRKRPPPDATRVARRVARFVSEPLVRLRCQEANDVEPKRVQRLNAGFFALEALRERTGAKERGKRKGKVRGR